MLTDGLVALILTQTPITSLIAGGNAIQPIPAPVQIAGNYPLITYQQASDLPDMTLTGTAGISTTRIVFDALAPMNPGGYSIARAIALAVKAALGGYSGILPDADSTQVWFMEIVNVNDNFDSATLLARSSVHVMVTYVDN
jgi:hypothetical protein